MASYQDVTFTEDQVLDQDTLQQMAANDRWLYDNLPIVNYTPTKKTTGVKIACGQVVIPASTNSGIGGNVSFGNFFTTGCLPAVVTGNGIQRLASLTVGGPTTTPQPDHTGFRWYCQNNGGYNRTQYFWWIAMGY